MGNNNIKEWFHRYREEVDNANIHHVVMVQHFDETRNLIINGFDEVKGSESKIEYNVERIGGAIEKNSEKIDEGINRIMTAKEDLSEFLQEQSEIDMKRFNVINMQSMENNGLI
jgi:hypothetical protein